MQKMLLEDTFDFISHEDKNFIIAFNDSMIEAGYDNNGIQPYVVFGKYKIEYYKPGNKTNNIVRMN